MFIWIKHIIIFTLWSIIYLRFMSEEMCVIIWVKKKRKGAQGKQFMSAFRWPGRWLSYHAIYSPTSLPVEYLGNLRGSNRKDKIFSTTRPGSSKISYRPTWMITKTLERMSRDVLFFSTLYTPFRKSCGQVLSSLLQESSLSEENTFNSGIADGVMPCLVPEITHRCPISLVHRVRRPRN